MKYLKEAFRGTFISQKISSAILAAAENDTTIWTIRKFVLRVDVSCSPHFFFLFTTVLSRQDFTVQEVTTFSRGLSLPWVYSCSSFGFQK